MSKTIFYPQNPLYEATEGVKRTYIDKTKKNELDAHISKALTYEFSLWIDTPWWMYGLIHTGTLLRKQEELSREAEISTEVKEAVQEKLGETWAPVSGKTTF